MTALAQIEVIEERDLFVTYTVQAAGAARPPLTLAAFRDKDAADTCAKAIAAALNQRSPS